MVQAYCDFGDCTEPAERVQEDGRALCAGHRKQMQRRGRLTEIQRAPLSSEEAVLQAGNAWLEADAEKDEDYEAARARFLGTAARWLCSMGWRPPARARCIRVEVVQMTLPMQVQARTRRRA